MSKDKVMVLVHGYTEDQFNNFLGRLLTLADTLGLEHSQREAYKSLVKQEVWSLFEHPKFLEDKESIFDTKEE